ncbi:HD domain-containing phosphohydrolase [Thalassoglobus sp. JC818]|uniref:HD-GYP domain-containing protein n=1 Tax=Thalassoglobus sp. JC818 TaxID=3232136 RepID=UPI003458162D
MLSVKRLVITLTAAQALGLMFGVVVLHNLENAALDSLLRYGTEQSLSPLLKISTLIWMVGVFFGINWLVVNRILIPVDDQLQQKNEETLLAMNELVRTRDAIIFGLAKLAESRDPDTGQHLERISLYSVRLATALRKNPKFQSTVNGEFIRMIGISSVLHDIGKVGVPDSLLFKQGPLTTEERVQIQIHAKIGSECIHQIERRLGNSDFLAMARDIALNHHEWWNGRGYPNRIQKTDIPLAARIVAVADVYDALASRRIYKRAYSHEECVRMICNNSGKQFDPEVVQAFLTITTQFQDIADRFADRSRPDQLSSAEAEFLSQVVESATQASQSITDDENLKTNGEQTTSTIRASK